VTTPLLLPPGHNVDCTASIDGSRHTSKNVANQQLASQLPEKWSFSINLRQPCLHNFSASMHDN